MQSVARLDRLTSLRFFAAAGVVICHTPLLTNSPNSFSVTARFATGVPFFFILSGFVLTWAHRPGDAAVPFWRKRVARVYPTHVTSWALALLLIHTLGHRHQHLHDTLLSMVLLHAWVPVSGTYFASNGVSWTLSVEAFFYLTFPLAVRWLWRLHPRARWVVTGACGAIILLNLLSMPLASHAVGLWWVKVFPVTQLPLFFIGIVLALQIEDGWRPRLSWPVTITTFVIGTVVSYLVPEPYWRVAPVVIPFSLIILHAVLNDLEDRPGPLRNPWLIKLGIWSFALYLCHPLVINVIGHAIGHPVGWEKGVILQFVVLGLSIPLSALLHELVERPLEKRLRGAPPRIELGSEHQATVPQGAASEDGDLGEVDREGRG